MVDGLVAGAVSEEEGAGVGVDEGDGAVVAGVPGAGVVDEATPDSEVPVVFGASVGPPKQPDSERAMPAPASEASESLVNRLRSMAPNPFVSTLPATAAASNIGGRRAPKPARGCCGWVYSGVSVGLAARASSQAWTEAGRILRWVPRYSTGMVPESVSLRR